jgi:pimeloyl-ACP methyl ester carboxylesterase
MLTDMANIILVAGTYYGGWYWEDLAENLRNAGHTVFTPTLSGLDSFDPPTLAINLDTHINDVLEIIEANQLKDVAMVGWSYGGMVITGAGARTKAKVSSLIFLDTPVPKSGDRELDLVPTWLQDKMLLECEDGLNMRPSDDFLLYEPRMKPHPIGTKLQPLRYDEEHFGILPKTYVNSAKPGEPSIFLSQFERIANEPGWTRISLPYGHDLYRDAPAEIEQIILNSLN